MTFFCPVSNNSDVQVTVYSNFKMFVAFVLLISVYLSTYILNAFIPANITKGYVCDPASRYPLEYRSDFNMYLCCIRRLD